MTTNPLDEIQARADAATEGPWEARDCPPCTERGRLEVNIWDHTGNFQIASWCDDDEFHRPDAVFIAHAREDVPKLVAALRAVEAVHQPSQRQHVSHTANGTIIGYKNVDDGPCVACYPEPRELHCEDCEDVDEICEGVRGSIGTWPCPTIGAIREALG